MTVLRSRRSAQPQRVGVRQGRATLKDCLVCALLALAIIHAPQARAEMEAQAHQLGATSSITKTEISSTTALGRFGGYAYRRVSGTIHGVVAVSEPVAG